MSPKIAQVVVGLPVEGPFDYAVPPVLMDKVAVGQRVRVLFNRRQRLGVIVGFKAKSLFKRLNPVLSCLDSLPVLDEKALAITKELSAYYACSWGEAIETWLPPALRTARPLEWTPPAPGEAQGTPVSFIKNITLLHDKSPDKRWPLILDMIRKTLDANRSVVFLVPEAALVNFVVAHLTKAVSVPVVIFDKRASAAKELERWIALREGKARVVVGTRSAVFAPAADLGLIVIYEEENTAYKQEQTPHYDARVLARMRAGVEGCSVVYVSSAPSAETWQQARKEKWQRITCEAERSSALQIVDMTNYNPQKTSILSFPLQNAIRDTLAQKGRVVLLMNRKGFTTRTHCRQCGFTVKCERCNVNLTYLYSRKVMVCRHCNFKAQLPKVCPQCHGGYLRSSGTGTEKLESEVARLYPQARVGRFDTNSKSFPRQTPYNPKGISTGQADIVITTKAVLREQGTMDASLIGVINFDAELHHLDFRCGHHAFALLVRLRQLAAQKLLVQTRMMDNYALQAASKNDFEGFYKKELSLRKELGFPPYRHLVSIGVRGVNEDFAFEQAKELFARLEKDRSSRVEISDPHPDVNPKLRDKYRFTILLKGPSVKSILAFIKKALKDFSRKRNTIVTVNVDP